MGDTLQRGCISIDMLIKDDLWSHATSDTLMRWSYLHRAIDRGDRPKAVRLTRFFLDKGASPNTRDSVLASPLHIAARRDCLDSMRLLLHAGANVNVRDIAGNSPLYLACRNKNFQTIEMLLKNKADVNHVNEMKNSALHMACAQVCCKAVELLVCAGANVSQKNFRGETPEQQLIRVFGKNDGGSEDPNIAKIKRCLRGCSSA